ncbi:MAG: nuclear transport factor 2 family protein [Thermoleophilia bacterium]|nr:nuclear transport factor 2 family protein [Thermoleophilia bacterium]
MAAKPTYEDLVRWMHDYFATYNQYAQNPDTVHRMDEFFAPDFVFVPYVYLFGGKDNPIRGREAFYALLTGHPTDYEQFKVKQVAVDERQMVAVAFLEASIYETATNALKVQKDYLAWYELELDADGKPKIKTVRFFWEATPPEVDAKYAVPPEIVRES